jgi:hypothetical protein
MILQPINIDELIRGREKLLKLQKETWYNGETSGLCLHVGSGHDNLKGFTNVDPYVNESDSKDDMRYLPSFKENSVSRIVSNHSMEHLPIRDFWKALRRWFQVLIPSGTIEIAMPDIELVAQMFLESQEKEKWNRRIFEMFGAQTEDAPSWVTHEWSTRDDYPFSEGQVHMSGLSLGHAVRMVEDAGFRMVDGFWYDGWGTGCFYIRAMKPEINITSTVLEKDTVIGVFTNRTDFLPDLWRSANKFLPHIQFMTRIHKDTIVFNMNRMRTDFIGSGKRFQIYIDHDIQFLDSDIIRNALATITKFKAAICTTYMTYNPDVLTSAYNSQGLKEQLQPWCVGYLTMIDTKKINPIPDMSLPSPNTAIDVSTSMNIRKAGYDICIAPSYVYHLQKYVPHDIEADRITQEYIKKKWGSFYTHCITPINVVIG